VLGVAHASVGVHFQQRSALPFAGALDRDAQARPPAERYAVYVRIGQRMNEEAAKDPGSSAARYWIIAAARNAGDLDRAWSGAIAAWILAPLGHDRGATLRADLERLVVQAIIPERAARLIHERRMGPAIICGKKVTYSHQARKEMRCVHSPR